MKELPTIPLQELIRTMIGTTVVGVVLLVVATAVSSFTGGNNAGVVGAGLETGEQGLSVGGIPKLEEGWDWYENSKENYTIALPANWRRIDVEPQAMDASIKEVAQNDSQLAGLLVAASSAGFFAVDSSETGVDKKYVTNLNIAKATLESSGPDLDSYTESSLKRLEGLDTVIKPIDHSRTRIASGAAEVLEYQMKTDTSKNTSNLTVTQYAVVTDASSYLMTFTTPSALNEKYASVFRKSAESFHFTGGAPLAAGGEASGNTNTVASSEGGTTGNAQGAGNPDVSVSSGVVQGQVIDATTGRPIVGAIVRIKGSSISANTDNSGSYQLTKAPAGDRRAVASSDSYITIEENIRVDNGLVTPAVFSLSPKLRSGEMRIVLNWGTAPQDLDAHLWLPTTNKEHIYHISERRGSTDGFPFSKLDVDATDGYGPETITIGKLYEGSYLLAVNQWSSDSTLGESKAVVRVYSGDSLINTFEAPKGEGRWWRVFSIDGSTGTVRPENVITKDDPAPYPG